MARRSGRDRWKAETPAYLPFRTADEHDKLWASKILMRFTREQIRAAVDAGRLSDPRAAEYITETLVARQRIAARHWFSRKSPLERFTPANGGHALCFDDLMLTYRLAPVAGATRYRWPRTTAAAGRSARGASCTPTRAAARAPRWRSPRIATPTRSSASTRAGASPPAPSTSTSRGTRPRARRA